MTMKASKTIAALATATPITIGVNDENDERVAREGSMAGT
jgi:hypothetical protein